MNKSFQILVLKFMGIIMLMIRNLCFINGDKENYKRATDFMNEILEFKKKEFGE